MKVLAGALLGLLLTLTPTTQQTITLATVESEAEQLEPMSEVAQPKLESIAVKEVKPEPVVRASGDWVVQCRQWASQAGVHLNSWAIELIDRESNCDPYAQNPTSTAYGIGQFLDSTWGGYGVKTSNPVLQLQYMEQYVMSRYGSWQQAVEHHNLRNWY